MEKNEQEPNGKVLSIDMVAPPQHDGALEGPRPDERTLSRARSDPVLLKLTPEISQKELAHSEHSFPVTGGAAGKTRAERVYHPHTIRDGSPRHGYSFDGKWKTGI